MPSPPKPWEVNNSNSGVTPVTTSTANMTNTTTTATTTASAPAVPNRPTTMSSAYGGLGTSSYGGMYGSSYSSPYNRYGYGGGGYGGYNSYGGYGSTYGGYGSSYSPYNRFGGYGYNRFGGGGGMFGEGFDNNSLTQRMEASTRATFDVIESIVQAFGGFAQMLDSTYMATHSSFMAMVGVAEQFGNLRHYLGNVFNVFALLRWLRRLLYRLIGRTPPAEPVENNNEGEPLQITEDEQPPEAIAPRNSNTKRRSVILFLAIVTGLPYVIYTLIQKSHERIKEQQQQRMMIPQYGGPIETARVIHDFIGENPMELTIRKGDLVYILSKIDPATGLPCDWWQGRLPNGAIGIFPANHVSVY
ncbi:hypothetical protein G6F70_003596 [Rhizopus microsporus]|uniref:Peroxisomal membrane protein PEX13 n=2 Tax=Rhizopus TaxID=4842 RepID=A0A367JBT5_RHIAZ|nr:hypothetical protein G6F71_002071 [Rhizopus microsporus]RCH87422.1 Peroxisomal membrane protein PAS20 [Rhizopus azygosporus]KAG1200967.1 hypothetical protein G6F70_003596 [Rhizopus microsporus]KAG1212798.1 hypothetical protein G6F69_003403 [Rhizopus microsporus]KAG1236418.1 hypothetical protein G6F67_002021 [Rhizopus microsporus]